MAARRPRRTVHRVVAGVRVRYEFDDLKKDVAVVPDETDLATAPAAAVVRLWADIGQWAAGLKKTHPGWTVGGEPAAIDELPDDLFGATDDERPGQP